MMKLNMRSNLILNILKASKEKDGLTISQIHDELYNKFLELVSRRTVTRDLETLVDYKLVRKSQSYPAKFAAILEMLKKIELTEEEISYLNKLLQKDMRDMRSQKIIQKLNE